VNEKYGITSDIIDRLGWEAQVGTQPVLTEAFADQKTVGADLYSALFRRKVEVVDPPPDAARARIYKAMLDSSAYLRLHQATMHDPMLSAGGALGLNQWITENGQEIKESLKNSAEADKLDEQREMLQDLFENPAVELSEETRDGIMERMDELQASAAGQRNAAVKAISNQTDAKLRAKMVASCNSTTEAIDTAQAIAGGWGNEPGIVQAILLNKSLMSTVTKDDRMKKIIALAGRMKEVITAERSKRPMSGPNKVNVVAGNDIENVISSELAMLADEDTEDVFYAKYQERSLLQYERQEKPRLGKGPFVVVIDESGSMAGDEIQWAKAITFALCTQARRERRKFSAISFSSTGDRKTWIHPTPLEFVECLQHFYGGGTEYEGPLTEAAKIIETEEPNGDIVLITDGCCRVSGGFAMQFKATTQRLGCKVIGLQVGSYGYQDSLKAVCDTAFSVSTSNGDISKLTDIVAAM